MSLDPKKLEAILHKGDTAAVRKFFRDASEAERTAVVPLVKEWYHRLDRNLRAQFDNKAAALVEKEGPLKNWQSLVSAANLAGLASLSLKQIESLPFPSISEPKVLVEVLRDRKPAWLDDYAEFKVGRGRDLTRWSDTGWRLARLLVRAGLCRHPKSDNYVLGALNGIKPISNWQENMRRREAGKPPLREPDLSELLLAERDWMDIAFWRLFELEGTGEVSLANSEKYSKGQSWTTAIVDLSKQGVLPRERLLDESLAALSRDFIQFRAGWFSRFHEAMSPTADEREKRLPVYFQLLGSSIPPTVSFALKAIQATDKAHPIPGKQLARYLDSALTARSKTAAVGALQLLDRAARREKNFAPTAALLAAAALLHESVDVQEKACDVLDTHGDPANTELRTKVSDVASHVAASLRKRLTPWLEKSAAPRVKPGAKPATHLSSPPARLAPERAIKPITTLDELILVASAVIESPDNPMEIERMLDGLMRLGADRPTDFATRTGPLRKRALKRRDDIWATIPRHPALDRALGMLLLTWIDGKSGFTEAAEKLGYGQNHFSFLFRRLEKIGNMLTQPASLPLLSSPTHAAGWIDPVVLVSRWLDSQKAGAEADLHEQVLALLRLAPENRKAALAKAAKVSGESGDALRFALGAKGRTGKNAPLWLAAWRSRQPHGDLPEFEKVHPKLGPDAGEAARYTWGTRSEFHNLSDTKWTTLELNLETQPNVPSSVNDALLPVLRHSEWKAGVEGEKPLLRWVATFWPAQRESFFARGLEPLECSVNYADALDRDVLGFLEPLAEPHTEIREAAALALALGLAAEDAALRGHAQEGLIAAIQDGRLNLPLLATTMSQLLSTGFNKLARWAKALREVARVSPAHTAQVAELMIQFLHGDAAKAPRDIHALLAVLVELLSELEHPLNNPVTAEYLRGLSAGGRTAKLVKQLVS